jgi:hypothetical protein
MAGNAQFVYHIAFGQRPPFGHPEALIDLEEMA